MTSGQRQALDQLQSIASVSDGRLELLDQWEPGDSEWTAVELSLDCRGFASNPEGLDLRARERIFVLIPPTFPFTPPKAHTPHTRFAGFPHVQWKRTLCMYLAPETEWSARDGMYGFMDRLEDWLRAGAKGAWEREGAPLHPPVAYSDRDAPLVIPRADTPDVDGDLWLGFAGLERVHAERLDITGWYEFPDFPGGLTAPAILLTASFPFEYPRSIGALLDELETAGVSLNLVLALLKASVVLNGADAPVHIVIGTAMRGIQGGELTQHLAVWRLPDEVAGQLRKTIHERSDPDEVTELRDNLAQAIIAVLEKSKTRWCPVREARPEVVRRRDTESPASWFRGQHVAVWGCGALGGHVAIGLARAGVEQLTLVDNGRVAPGLLERQPYTDADLGQGKVEALRKRLQAINPELAVSTDSGDLIKDRLAGDDWSDGAALVIDATGNRLVRERLEERRWQTPAPPCPLVSMMIDRDAQRGLMALAPKGFSGGPSDLIRRAKIKLSRQPHGNGFLDAFWPNETSALFLPEPGCSSPTFVGSAADVMRLSAGMLNSAARELRRDTDEGSVHLEASHHDVLAEPEEMRPRVFRWSPDHLFGDAAAGYEVRVSQSAWRSIRGWIREGARTVGADVETGGLLFGERNDAIQIVWVDDAVGPPPDSKRSEAEFVCGVRGVEEANRAKRRESRDSVGFVGMWHTHPSGEPLPSPRDVSGMTNVVHHAKPTPRRALLLIVGRTALNDADYTVGTYLFDRSTIVDQPHGLMPEAVWMAPEVTVRTSVSGLVGLALSGGGARAMAFHLGCLRALSELGILERVRVISAVSGGSVLGAMYAYSDGDFRAFEERVRATLREGLQGKIVKAWLNPLNLLRSTGIAVGPGSMAAAAGVTQMTLRAALRRTSGFGQEPAWLDKIQPPFRRSWSRTTAFEQALEQHLFPGLTLDSPRHGGMEIVLNATELRTMSAFRFGSRESGSWRFGRLAKSEKIALAHAVACSAAYPAILPAMDRFYELETESESNRERLILTDGGVYDNLGVTCLEPGRDEDISFNVFPVSHIIACDAGHGLPSASEHPFWWPGRMKRSFLSAHRQAHRGVQNRLHRHAASGAIEGFIYAYLGVRDHRLPYIPGDWISRDDVVGYPTDFASMAPETIDMLSGRGERLVRLLVDHYAPRL